jgi:hypothetical protein
MSGNSLELFEEWLRLAHLRSAEVDVDSRKRTNQRFIAKPTLLSSNFNRKMEYPGMAYV